MANRLQYARNFNPYGKNVTIEELRRVRRQLAKVMNQRMVRLEQNKSPITGESYTFGAYNLMSDYLKKKDRNRFSEVLKPKDMSKKDLQKEIRTLQGFEELKSSQISGMHQIEKLRKETLTADVVVDGQIVRHALNEETVSNKDFYDFLNSKTYSELVEKIDSDKIVEMFDRTSTEGATKDQIVSALNDYIKKAKRLSIKGVERALGAIEIE